MVSAAQKAAIKASWVGIDLTKAGVEFYVQMHDTIPDVYAVFKLGDDPRAAAVAAQGLKIMEFVDAAVKGIDNMDGVDKKLAELSQRHTKYGAKKSHFGLASPCFLNALAATQGPKFNADAKSAWAVFYDHIAAGISAKLS